MPPNAHHDTVGVGEVQSRAAEMPPGLGSFSGDAGNPGTAVRFVDETLG
jgi:hypothetical protein